MGPIRSITAGRTASAPRVSSSSRHRTKASSYRGPASVRLNPSSEERVMKTIPTALAILLTALAPFTFGCAAQTSDEPTENGAEALMNNGGGPQGPSMDDLLAAGYHCVGI